MSLQAMPVEHERLSAKQIARLRAKLGGKATPFVGKDTTELEAGFLLGVQFCLYHLENGWETNNQ